MQESTLQKSNVQSALPVKKTVKLSPFTQAGAPIIEWRGMLLRTENNHAQFHINSENNLQKDKTYEEIK